MVGDSVMVPGWSAPNDTSALSVPVAVVEAVPGLAGVSGLPPSSRSSYTVCATVAAVATGMSFSTLMVKAPVSGMKSPSASVATRIDDRLIGSSASSLSLVSRPWSSWSSSVNVYAPDFGSENSRMISQPLGG